ncbi:MAG: hypothetical protein ACP5E4_04275 [Candidatus Aenigmatarchaeota archaeon]
MEEDPKKAGYGERLYGIEPKTIFFEEKYGEDVSKFKSTTYVNDFMERQLGRPLGVISIGTNLIRRPVLRIKPYNIDREFNRELEGNGNTDRVDVLDLLYAFWEGAKDYWNQAKENIYRKAK